MYAFRFRRSQKLIACVVIALAAAVGPVAWAQETSTEQKPQLIAQNDACSKYVSSSGDLTAYNMCLKGRDAVSTEYGHDAISAEHKPERIGQCSKYVSNSGDLTAYNMCLKGRDAVSTEYGHDAISTESGHGAISAEKHYGTAAAAAAIAGLLVYGAVAHPDFMKALGQSLADGGTRKLMIFAGSSHATYLGCLNCAQTAPDSVSNQYGQNGSRFSQTSIWNHFSQFGSIFGLYSVCNRFSTDPPVIVDDAGTYYGRLTLNQFQPELGAGRQLIPWLTQVVCAQ